MGQKLLRLVIGLLGLVPILIGATGMISGLAGLIGDSSNIDARSDGQYRYFSAIYLGFGCLLIWIQARFAQEITLFRLLMAMVFIAGVGRAIAFIPYGIPTLPVVLATAFELVFPPIFVLWHSKIVNSVIASNPNIAPKM